MIRFFSRDHGCVGGEHEVDARVGHQIGLELGDVHIQGAIEAERGGQRRDHLCDESVQIGVGGALNVQRTAADVVDSLVIEHHRHVGVLQQGVGGEHGVVRLDDGGGNLRGRVDGESELGFLAIVHGETLQEEGAKSRASSSTDGVEHQKALEAGAIVGQFADSIQAEVDDFFAHGVVTTCEVIGGIFFAGDELFGVEELAVGAGADLVNDGGLEIDEDAARDVFAGTGLREEGVESIVGSTDGLVSGHGAIRLDAVLQAVELPAGITNLDTGLAL